MKSKQIIYCLLSLCLFAMTSCGPENVDYANKVVGNYDVKITPNLNLKFAGTAMPSISSTEINTTGTIIKDNEDGDVTIKINGINGYISDIEMKAICSGLGMNIDESSYDGILHDNEYGMIKCDFNLTNPTTTISNAKIFNWNSTISGQCDVNYIGLDMKCDATGSFNFYLSPTTAK